MAQPCAVCPKKTVLGCSICRNIFFCSTQCQRLVWKSHDLICRKDKGILEQPYLTPAESNYILTEIKYSRRKAEAQYEEFNRWEKNHEGGIEAYVDLMKPSRALRWKISQAMTALEEDGELNASTQQSLLDLRQYLGQKTGWTHLRLRSHVAVFYYLADIEEGSKHTTSFGEILSQASEEMCEAMEDKWTLSYRKILNPYLRQALIAITLETKKKPNVELRSLANVRLKALEPDVGRELTTLQNEMQFAIKEGFVRMPSVIF